MSHSDLIAANEEFYRAFESRQVAEMDRMWWHDDSVACIHPGWRMLRGWAKVRQSWEQVFQALQHIQFIVTDVTAHVDGDVGWVNCVENIITVPTDAPNYATVHATNVFRRQDGAWRMVVHHASPFVVDG